MKHPTWSISFNPKTGKIRGIDLGDGRLRSYILSQHELKKKFDKELDVLDWGVRSMRVLGILSMKQMILVLRLLMKSQGRKRRFSTKEIAEMCQ